jgi:hypothetical protein
VHDLLIEKGNGTYELAVWDDRPAGEGTDNITVNLGGTYATVNLYDPTIGTTATQTLGNVSTVALTLSDHPVVIELSTLPAIDSALSATATNGVAFAYQITATNSPTLYSASGLPAGLSVNTATGMISGTATAIGVADATISAASASGSGSATLAITVRTSFTSWENLQFTAAQLANPAISGDAAMPAGDGITNLMKYALNLNPMVHDTSGLPVGSATEISGSNYLELSYTQLLYAADITYIPEVSGDMRTWSSGIGYTTPVSFTPNGNGTTETVLVRDLTPATATTPRFMRLRVTGP